MHLEDTKRVLLRTHMAALQREQRASGYVLESGPGLGKTQGVFQYAEMLALATSRSVGIVQFMLSTVTSADVRGFMLPIKPEPGQPMQTIFSVPPWFPTAANTTVVVPDGSGGCEWCPADTWEGEVPEIGIVFLDEWGQADEDVKKPAAELVLNGNVGTCHLPIGWRVVAAQNRMSDRSGVSREMMFIVNRRCLLSVTPNLQMWLRWATSQPVGLAPHYMTIAFAETNPGVVFQDKVPDDPNPFCTPRSLCLMDRDLQALASDEDEIHPKLPMDDLAREVCAGWIGEGAAGQFFAHLKYSEQLPELADIVREPGKAKLPPGRDVQMVLAYMLAHRITEDNAAPVFKYITRLNQEMQIASVLAISADKTRVKHIIPLEDYNTWLMTNKSRLYAAQA